MIEVEAVEEGEEEEVGIRCTYLLIRRIEEVDMGMEEKG